MADLDSERELVTIQSFRDLSEAMLAEGMLNSAGIECFLVDDNTGRMLGFISNVIGGIRMKVNKADAEAATKLLEQLIPESVDVTDEGDDHPPRCPKCYSVDMPLTANPDFRGSLCHFIGDHFTVSVHRWLGCPLVVLAFVERLSPSHCVKP